MTAEKTFYLPNDEEIPLSAPRSYSPVMGAR